MEDDAASPPPAGAEPADATPTDAASDGSGFQFPSIDIPTDAISHGFNQFLVNFIFPLAVLAGVVAMGWLLVRNWSHEDPRSLWARTRVYILQFPLAAFMVLCSVGLSIASFWTTLGGMTNMVNNAIIAFLTTLGIQGLMLVFAWKLGFDLYNRAGKSSAAAVVFAATAYAMAMALSSFFSADKLFDVVFSGEERVQWSTASTSGRVATILDALRETNDEAVRENSQSRASGDWPSFLNRLTAVEARLAAMRDELERDAQAAEEERRRRRQAAQELQASRSEIEFDLAQAQVREQEADEIIADADRRSQAWNAQYGELKSQIDLLTLQMEQEEGGELGGRADGRGPVWRTLNDQRRPLMETYESGPKQEFERIEAMRADAIAERREARETIAALSIRLAGMPADSGSASSSSSSGVDAASRAENLADDLARLDAAGGLQQLAAAFSASPTAAAWDTISRQCAELEANLASEGAAGAGCNVAVVDALARRAVDLFAGREFLRTRCVLSDDDLSQLTADEMVTRATVCIDNSGLEREDLIGARSGVLEIRRTRSASAHHFTLVRSALADGENLAWMAVVIAILIDSMVLLSSLIGVQVMVDPMMRAGLTRLEAAQLRAALEAAPASAWDVAAFVTSCMAGPAPRPPSFTRIGRDGVSAEDWSVVMGVVQAAAGAQSGGSTGNPTARFVLVPLAGLIGALIGGAMTNATWGLVVGGLGGLALAVIVAREVAVRRARVADRADEAPRLVHYEFDDDPEAIEPKYIAVSGMFLNAMQIASKPDEQHDRSAPEDVVASGLVVRPHAYRP